MPGKTSLISGICSMLTVRSLSCGRAGSGSGAPVLVVSCVANFAVIGTFAVMGVTPFSGRCCGKNRSPAGRGSPGSDSEVEDSVASFDQKARGGLPRGTEQRRAGPARKEQEV